MSGQVGAAASASCLVAVAGTPARVARQADDPQVAALVGQIGPGVERHDVVDRGIARAAWVAVVEQRGADGAVRGGVSHAGAECAPAARVARVCRF